MFYDSLVPLYVPKVCYSDLLTLLKAFVNVTYTCFAARDTSKYTNCSITSRFAETRRYLISLFDVQFALRFTYTETRTENRGPPKVHRRETFEDET